MDEHKDYTSRGTSGDKVERKQRLIAAATTVVVMAVVVLICSFMALYPPDPPIPEEGVEVNLGDADYGLGNVEEPDNSQNMRPSVPPAHSDGERVATQQTPSVGLKTATSDRKADQRQNTQTHQQEPTPQQQTNDKALFPGKRNNSSGGSQGVKEGAGNQGQQGGDPNSKRYDGAPGNGGSGYSLKGRKASSLPEPGYTSQREGKVIVKIWVDRTGKVVKVEAPQKGSSITETGMVNQAKNAAMKARFTASDNAPELQVGTITYVFRRNN